MLGNSVELNQNINVPVNSLIITGKNIPGESVRNDATHSANAELSKEALKKLISKEMSPPDTDKLMEELSSIISKSDVLNKRIRLSVNPQINRIIITVLHKQTGELIRQIPCEELQHLAEHLREASGIFYDKEV